jgi:hypothetical protein
MQLDPLFMGGTMSIQRLPWYKTIRPNPKMFPTDKAYVEAWLALCVRHLCQPR